MIFRRTFLQLAAVSARRGQGKIVANAVELAAAVKTAKPGEEILLADGRWTDADLVVEGTGTPEAPVTVRAQTPGQVILNGQSRLRLAGRYVVVDGLRFEDGYSLDAVIAFRAAPNRPAHHCRVTNCAIYNYNVPDHNRDTKWVSLYGTDNRFDHCSVRGKTNAGTTLVVWLDGEANHHRIDHNHFGARPPLGQNGGETIRVGTSDWSGSNSRTVVESNYFSECNGEVEIISNKSCENIYRRNTFVACAGTLTLRHGNRCLVEENHFLGQDKPNTGGVRIVGEDHRVVRNTFVGLAGELTRSGLSMMNGLPDSLLNGYFQVKRAEVTGNVFLDCRATMTLGIVSTNPKGATLAPLDCLFRENYLRSRSGPLVRYLTAGVGARWERNVAFGAEVGFEAGEGIVVADRPVPKPASSALTAAEVGPEWLR